MANERTLFQFNRPEEAQQWHVVTDEVMGGDSSSEFRANGSGYAKFAGDVSLENGGGFAACRCDSLALDLSTCDSLWVRVRGDGKTYGVTLRSRNSSEEIYYATEITTRANEWEEYTLPFSSFQPRVRGRYLTNAPRLSVNQISSVGFIISKRQEGQFHLDVDWIKAARTAYPLDAHRWKHRLVFIFAPSRLSRAYLEQNAELAKHEKALRERSVVLVDAFEDGGGREGGKALPPEQVAMLRDYFAIDPGTFAVIMVDKDGGEKLRGNAPMRGADLLAWIDEMPATAGESA